MVCAAFTARTAMARDIRAHRRWALRTFLLVNGVWFFRLGFGFWILVNGGSAPGSTRALDGPFDVTLVFAQFLLPLAILEIYLRVRDRAGVAGRLAMAGGLLAVTAAMGAGVVMASLIFWLPRLGWM
ncbi:MAG: hypothetical protein MI723_07420, partial [Caulobacterales bacterium]|nr:hypothetical protein [Caulobacterales bacterium]